MKARVKFSKMGSMRFIGHLDVMRYFQKAFRRAKIAVSCSQGFSPHPIMSFASPLGIGLSSEAEYLDLVLEDPAPVEDFVERANRAMNREIRVRELTVLQEDARPSMAVLAACDYLIAVKPGRTSFLLEEERRRRAVEHLLLRDSVEICKKTKRSEQMADIRGNIYAAACSPAAFAASVGRDHSASAPELADHTPVLFLQLTAGSIVNIKPELVLAEICRAEGERYDAFAYQIHRLEMYADSSAARGELHTLSTEPPCRLVPLSQYDRKQ